MSFDTYANLQAGVLAWLHRPNLSARVPEFIQLAEAEINRKLNIAPREVEASLATVIGSRYVARPHGQPLALWLEASGRPQLVKTTPEQMAVSDAAAAPALWAIDGANLAFQAPADEAYTLTYRHVQDAALSDANPTSELLTRAPDLYLYGALTQAAPYMRDDNRIGMWEAKFLRLLRTVHAEYSRTKAAPLRTDLPMSFQSR